MTIEPYILLMSALGALILIVAWLPLLLRKLPMSLAIGCVGMGLAIALGWGGQAPMPLSFPDITERLTELVVIVALMGAGLKLDRPIGWKSWRLTWRLLAIAMPLSIAAIAILGWLGLGLSVSAAVLLGALLAPTDPVLAADVQVGPPGADDEESDEVRFALTSEAGLNDGLAFPFVNLAIAMAAVGSLASDWSWAGEWLLRDVLWKLTAGVAAGYLVGKAFGWLTFRFPEHLRLSRTGDGFVALGLTLFAYGITEMIHGYGFLAVFVTALSFRAAERRDEFHRDLHDFAEQTERILMLLVLVLFGSAIAGGLLAGVTWVDIAAALAIILIIRPLAGWIALIGVDRPVAERAVIVFFGIRGIGSFYYLAYGLNHAVFDEAEELWRITGLVVLMSIVIHGISATPLMNRLDRIRFGRGDGASSGRKSGA